MNPLLKYIPIIPFPFKWFAHVNTLKFYYSNRQNITYIGRKTFHGSPTLVRFELVCTQAKEVQASNCFPIHFNLSTLWLRTSSILSCGNQPLFPSLSQYFFPIHVWSFLFFFSLDFRIKNDIIIFLQTNLKEKISNSLGDNSNKYQY